MKKIHILGIVVIAVAIGVIFTSLQSSSTYSDFTEAAANPDTEYHVVGKLNKAVQILENDIIVFEFKSIKECAKYFNTYSTCISNTIKNNAKFKIKYKIILKPA